MLVLPPAATLHPRRVALTPGMDDYRRLFARYRAILLIGIVVGALVALLAALAKGTTYSSTASLQVQDLSQIEGIVADTVGGSTLQPAQLSASAQRSVTSDAVLSRALSAVPGERDIQTLRDHVSGSVDPNSGLLLVTADASSATRATAVANAVATATAAVSNAQTRARFTGYALQLQQRIAQIPSTPASRTIRDRNQINLARLQALAIVAEPVKVAQHGDVPTAAASRHIGFSVLLGAVLGLILALAVAAVRELLDRTVHAPADVDARLDLPIVGHVKEDDLGASPFLTDAPDDGAVARFGILRRNVETIGEAGPPQAVLVTSPGPDEGKTSVALSLACAFAAVGRRTLLLEADLRRPSLAQRTGLAPESPGFAAYVRDRASANGAGQTLALRGSDRAASLTVLLSGADGHDPAELLASERLPRAIQELATAYDTVVIDAPPLLPVPDTLELLDAVDAYLVCVRAGRTRLAQLDAMRDVLRRQPMKPGAVVITGATADNYELGGYEDNYTAGARA
ncbi:MAG: hypothetical protein ACJ76X_18635 [Solirubrobacteraceae bacterium]